MESLIRTTWNLYVVRTRTDKPAHHGLHTNRSPHLLTGKPTEGDEIVAVLEGFKYLLPSNGMAVGAELSSKLAIETHPAKGSGFEEIVPELLTPHDWDYAPCKAKESQERRYYHYARPRDDGAFMFCATQAEWNDALRPWEEQGQD